MDPREGYEIVTLGRDNPPEVGDVLVAGGLEFTFVVQTSQKCFYHRQNDKYITWNYGMEVYRPLPPKDAKDEEIEFLKRALEQAIETASLQVVAKFGTDDDIEMCGEYYRSAYHVPELYKYLQDKKAGGIGETP